MDLRELSSAIAVSGFEKTLGHCLEEVCKPYADEVFMDAMGNVFALKKGSGENKKTIMACAHMDEIGFCVTKVDSKGYVKVRPLGGQNGMVVYMNRVVFKSGAIGIFGNSGGTESLKPREFDKMYIDIGCSSKEEAEKLVQAGDYCCFVPNYIELPENKVSGKALDDRIGCYVMLECLKKMGTPYNDVYFVFTVQEEVGLRGATGAAARLNPDIGIAIDVTYAFDSPNDQGENEGGLGKGAAVKIMDSSVICDEYLAEMMVKCAEDNNIKYYKDIIPGGGTDAGAINTSNYGVRTAGISIPERYCHTPNGVVDMTDVAACVDLLEKYVDLEFVF